MALISLQEISVAFGGPLIFDQLSLQLEAGERVALLGRNGAGNIAERNHALRKDLPCQQHC